MARGRSGPDRPPGRLHLRRAGAATTASARTTARKSVAGRLPQPACALQDRSGDPEGCTTQCPWIRHLGRSRSGQQLRQRRAGGQADARRRSWSVAPTRTRPTTSTCRCARRRCRKDRRCRCTGACPTEPGGVHRARYAPVPHRSAMRRRHQGALRRRVRPQGDASWATRRRPG